MRVAKGAAIAGYASRVPMARAETIGEHIVCRRRLEVIKPKASLGKDLRFGHTSTGALGFTYQVTVRVVTAVIGGVARSVEAASLAASANVSRHAVP